MLHAVGDQIVQRKSVVAGDEVDADLRLALLAPVNLRTAQHSVSDARYGPVVAAKKTPYIVAELPVPLTPAIPGEAPDLIESGRIPGLGDQFRPCQRRVRLDVP